METQYLIIMAAQTLAIIFAAILANNIISKKVNNSLNTEFKKVADKLEFLTARIEVENKNVDYLVGKFSDMEKRIDSLEKRVTKLENQ